MTQLTIHRPKSNQYKSNTQFGAYLAGLIDGGGHFDTQGCCVIAFNSRDQQLAQMLRTRLSYGRIYKMKEKKAVILKISCKVGLLVLSRLIHNKLKHPIKINQFNMRIVPKFNGELNNTSTDTTLDFKSAWLAGFIDADGQLAIRILMKTNNWRPEIRLLLKIDQKSDILIKQIHNYFGGYLGYRSLQYTYYYSSTSFANMKKILKYLDKFTPKNKYMCLQYILMRKSYLLVQSKLH